MFSLTSFDTFFQSLTKLTAHPLLMVKGFSALKMATCWIIKEQISQMDYVYRSSENSSGLFLGVAAVLRSNVMASKPQLKNKRVDKNFCFISS